MSTIVCIAERGTLVLGTDSRRMKHDFSAIDSDAVEKVFQLGPRCFIAPMGWNLVADFQAQKARELVASTTDIRALAEALNRESQAVLRQLVKVLAGLAPCDEISASLSGRLPLHRFVLAGDAAGELGWICVNYFLENGEIVVDQKERFGTRRSIYVADAKALRHE